jgi:hypothetical protein
MYKDIDDDGILDDINSRKEFKMLVSPHKYTAPPGIVPQFPIAEHLKEGRHIRFKAYQLFVQGFMSPNSPYTRLLINHDMGTGKTISAIGVALEYVKYFDQRDRSKMVYIIGYTRPQFERDLFKFPNFGFINRREQIYLEKIRKNSERGSESDVLIYKEMMSKLRRRLGNGVGNGFFSFIGYRELSNKVFGNEMDISKMSAADIVAGIKSNKISINAEYVAKFEGCLIVCDEVHNIYNSNEKNNWGVAIQYILNEHGNKMRALFLSGTPLKNSQTEIVDLLNLLAGTNTKKFKRADYFTADKQLKPGAAEEIAKISTGRVSFLVDSDPELYPTQEFVGEPIGGEPYLKYIRCPMSKAQDSTRDKSDNKLYLYDIVFPNPTKGGVPIHSSAHIRMISAAPDKWKKANMIHINSHNKTPDGAFLQHKNIGKYSGKYAAVLAELFKIMAADGGKSFLYHSFVRMSGVHLLANMMRHNGIIEAKSTPSDATRCYKCGVVRVEHKSSHDFKSARFVVVHGMMSKRMMISNLNKFNAPTNLDGSEVMMVIGSRVMREAFDLIACRHVMIINRPDNIPSLLQIVARAVRSGSHKDLDKARRNVKIYLYTSRDTREEELYIEKVRGYQVIQQIERSLHISAVDAVVNRKTIEPALVESAIGHLRFDPPQPSIDEEMASFQLHYQYREVEDILIIIKRLFIEVSPAWKEVELFGVVKSPPFPFEYDTSMFSKSSYNVALHRLVWSNDFLTAKSNNMVDVLLNGGDKRLIMRNRTPSVVVRVGEYLITLPIINGKPGTTTDAPYRLSEMSSTYKIDVGRYTRNVLTKKRYIGFKNQFMSDYRNKALSDMTDIICKHGPQFHATLVEEIVDYVFNIWTNPKMKEHPTFNEFYFRMLYYYDAMGMIVWMNTVRDDVRRIYDDYDSIIDINTRSSASSILPKYVKTASRGELVQIARSIERSGCSWCPDMTAKRYDAAIHRTKIRMAKTTGSPTDDIVPVGHFIENPPRFYHPNRGWFSAMEYGKTDMAWVENNIIIGFDTMSDGGLHIRFRLRRPEHKLKHHKDTRLVERGIICKFKSKEYLMNMARRLKIKLPQKKNTKNLCSEIRARLMYLELIERARGTNIKYFYNHFEPK